MCFLACFFGHSLRLASGSVSEFFCMPKDSLKLKIIPRQALRLDGGPIIIDQEAI